jgi:fatty-acyl-CoA synthase
MSFFDDPHLAPRPANHRPLTPLDLLERTLEIHGHRPGVAWRDRVWSWGAFGGVIARMTARLAEAGIGRGDVVSAILPNRPEMLAAHFAVPAVGAVLNTINIRLGRDEVAYILDHSGSRFVLCDGTTRALAEGGPAPLLTLCDGPEDRSALNLLDGAPGRPDWQDAVTDEWQPISLNYTSGTTGRPKGVVYHHRGAYLNALGNLVALGLDRRSRYLWTLPMFHCNGWCHTWAVTAAGGLHVCLDRVEPAPIFDLIARHAVSHMACAPVVLYMLLAHGAPPIARPVRVVTGGAAPTPSLIEGLERLGFETIHAYGLTECYGPATFNDPGEEAPATVEARARLLARQGVRHLTVGHAAIHDEAGRPVPADGVDAGEIVLAGNTLMAGYYRDPEATARAFEGGVFHTGDLAALHEEGGIAIRDRIKDIIISGGENISSLEVETVLHQHPDVLLAAVVAAPDEKWGETPWAFVEPKEGRQLSPEALDAFCRDRLAGFKRPRRFILGPLPRTATGKIQKFVLRRRASGEGAE